VIAYSHCIAHGYPLQFGLDQQKLAVDSGYWPLFRYNPRRTGNGETPFKLDSPPPKIELSHFTANETRFGILQNIAPERAAELAQEAQVQVHRHYALYQQLAAPANGATAAAKGHAAPDSPAAAGQATTTHP
jgi:pyruvate-ferredoxin/flavodoxin oxidoreductase